MDNNIVNTNLELMRDSVKVAESAASLARKQIIALILNTVGENTPVTFNDATGFPGFSDYYRGYKKIVAVRVYTGDGKKTLQFNASCGDDCYGLDPCGWFDSDSGWFDIGRMASYLEAAIIQIYAS